MKNESGQGDDTANGHYRTAGLGLIILGAINCVVAATSLYFGADNIFIGFDMMLLFGASFLGVGIWMRNQNVDDSST